MSGAATFVHDGDGNRAAKTSGGVTTQYLVDDANPTGLAQVAEEVVNGAVTRRYVYGLARISQTQANGTSYYGYDAHGDVRTLMNASGTVTDTYDYDAFGNLIASTGTTPNVYRYQGEALDTETGLYYLRARYYDPISGRFVSVDPLADQGEHPYSYSSANPVDGHDPTGLQDVFEYKALLVGPLTWPHFSLAMAAGGGGGSGSGGGGSGSGDGPGPGPGCMGGGGGALNAMAKLDQVGACSAPKPRPGCQVSLRFREVHSQGNGIVSENHAFFRVKKDSDADWKYAEGGPQHDSPMHWNGWGYVVRRYYAVHDPSFEIATDKDNASGDEKCKLMSCILQKAQSLEIHSLYNPVFGPNSNTWAHRLATACGMSCTEPNAGNILTGWNW
jgi:RHS repeat-associated protein